MRSFKESPPKSVADQVADAVAQPIPYMEDSLRAIVEVNHIETFEGIIKYIRSQTNQYGWLTFNLPKPIAIKYGLWTNPESRADPSIQIQQHIVHKRIVKTIIQALEDYRERLDDYVEDHPEQADDYLLAA